MTLMPGKFYPPSNFPESDLRRRADSRWALPQISSFICCNIIMGIADSSSGNCHYQFLYVIAGTAIAHFSRLNSVCLSV